MPNNGLCPRFDKNCFTAEMIDIEMIDDESMYRKDTARAGSAIGDLLFKLAGKFCTPETCGFVEVGNVISLEEDK